MSYSSPFQTSVRLAANNWLFENFGEDLFRLTAFMARSKAPNRDVREALEDRDGPAFSQAVRDLQTDLCCKAFQLDLALKYEAPDGDSRKPCCTTGMNVAQCLAALNEAAHNHRKDLSLYLAGSIARRVLKDVSYDTYRATDSTYISEQVTEETITYQNGEIIRTVQKTVRTTGLREAPASSFSAKEDMPYLAETFQDFSAADPQAIVTAKKHSDAVRAAQILVELGRKEGRKVLNKTMPGFDFENAINAALTDVG